MKKFSILSTAALFTLLITNAKAENQALNITDQTINSAGGDYTVTLNTVSAVKLDTKKTVFVYKNNDAFMVIQTSSAASLILPNGEYTFAVNEKGKQL